MFLVLGLPRSRTFWLSKFLSYGDYECAHEESRYLRSADDAKTWIKQDFHGSAETAIAPFWRLFHKHNPDLRIVVVRRPVEDVVRSFMALDLRGICDINEDLLTKNMRHLDAKLRQIAARAANTVSVDFKDLDNVEVIRRVFEHCVPYRFDPLWWHRLLPINLQCNMRSIARYVLSYKGELDRMGKIAASLSRAQLYSSPPLSSEGVTFQQESFDDWIRDGQAVFQEHLVTVGESPDNWQNKDLPLMKMMYDTGYMQITTARANGRMFGYVMVVINPSLEMRGKFSGLHNTFCVSKDMPGIGVKLQRASIAALRARGAKEAVFFEGTRGDGPRLGALYRRLGAQESGKLYSLELNGA